MIEIMAGTTLSFKKYKEEKVKKTILIRKDDNKLFVKNYQRYWCLDINNCEILKIGEINLKNQNFIVKHKEKIKKVKLNIDLPENICKSVINSIIKVCENDQYRDFDKYFKTKIPNNCKFMKEIDYFKEKFTKIPENPGVYVLLCEEKHIYVGQTYNILSRIIQHFIGIGCEKTYKFKPIKILDFYVMKEYNREKLLKLEKFYYDFYKEKYPEYTVMM